MKELLRRVKWMLPLAFLLSAPLLAEAGSETVTLRVEGMV